MKIICAFRSKYIFIISVICILTITNSLQVHAQDTCDCSEDGITSSDVANDKRLVPIKPKKCPCLDIESPEGNDTTTTENACTGASNHALNTVCHESSWSHITKATAAFSASQASGDIKSACEAAKTLNGIGGTVNTEFMTSCGGALSTCITTCEGVKSEKETTLTTAKARLKTNPTDAKAAELEAKLPAEIAEIEQQIATCSKKKKSNLIGGNLQIAQNAQAFLASDKCSKDAGDDDSQTAISTACSDFPQSLQALCHQNGPTETCNQYPGLPICQRLKAEEGNIADRDPLDLDNLDEGLTDDLAFGACLENPLSSSCQSSFCSGLPTSVMRDVCNTDGVQAFCENLPDLPQCASLASAANGGNCGGLPTQNLIEECQASGRDSFCDRHSQLTFCQDAENGNSEFSELAQEGSGGGLGGSGGGLFSGGGLGGKDSGFDSNDSIGGGGEEGELTPEEIQALREKGINTGGASAGAFGGKGSGFNPGKFKPFDIKGLFGKKKKDKAQRGISSVNASLEISSANGLTNFQKVSRRYKAWSPVLLKDQVKQANRAF